MTAVVTFRDLDVWQVAMGLVVQTYKATDSFPMPERYGLTAQIRRCVVSIPANVAEGHARRSPRVYLNHINIALGSQAELDTELEIAVRLGFLEKRIAEELRRDIDRLRQLLHGLRRSVRRRYASSLTGAALLGLLVCATLLS